MQLPGYYTNALVKSVYKMNRSMLTKLPFLK